MAAPATPKNFYVQQGNGQVFLLWDLVAGATSYSIKRSTDGVVYSLLATSLVNSYLDATVIVQNEYYYQINAINVDGPSLFTDAQAITPVKTGDMTLSQIRLLAQQKCDRVNSKFVTLPEWNTYINQSYFELYDMLVTSYEDYYMKDLPFKIITTGENSVYDLPDDFYKAMGVDLGLDTSQKSMISLKKFNWSQRNAYVFPQVLSNQYGYLNLRYRVIDNKIRFIPTPANSSQINVWYIPKMKQLLKETDVVVGISGWTEYIVVDAAIKAMIKEESDASALMAQKMGLIKRIEETAVNRDAMEPDTISNTRDEGINNYSNGVF